MKKLAIALALVSAFTFSASAEDQMDQKKMGHEKNIYDTAAKTEMFSTLTAALKAGGKREMLQEDKGPFTVFAPTDDAFKKLPEGTVEDLLKPENKEKLGKILAYHVVKGKVMAADVKTMEAESAEGSKLNVKVDDGKVMVNDAKVVKTDIMASNGVIHVIDTVLMPPDLK
ncbi:MAG: fasciclin domain-containing protein [Verrucomicrobiota bacterium]|nr:fasciclin domain-containing protein [Verrucomicrobiota bacterium]